MEAFLELEREEHILIARMNRPDSRNALTKPEYMQEFVDLCADIRRDRSIKVLVLTGNGPAFCAGGNVKDMRDRSGIFEGGPADLRNQYRDGIQRIPLCVYELDIPVIAAINGPAIGAGLDLACMCDVRVAADSAKFAESFIKLGLVPGDGGAWLLQRVIGKPRATLMSLTGDMINSEQALEYGLITDAVPADKLMARAMEIARSIAGNPAHALRLTKRLLREAEHLSLPSLLEMSAAYQALAHHTDDHSEAVNAFLERREPQFSGN